MKTVKAATVRANATVLLCLALGASPGVALGTKPCPPPPCESKGGSFDAVKCRDLAAWIAVGTISNVVHHEQGPPLSKDFAEFTFTVQTWEKGTGQAGQTIAFRVGWCENSQTLPRETSGPFRFFGHQLPADPALPSQYLHFEPVRPTRP